MLCIGLSTGVKRRCARCISQCCEWQRTFTTRSETKGHRCLLGHALIFGSWWKHQVGVRFLLVACKQKKLYICTYPRNLKYIHSYTAIFRRSPCSHHFKPIIFGYPSWVFGGVNPPPRKDMYGFYQVGNLIIDTDGFGWCHLLVWNWVWKIQNSHPARFGLTDGLFRSMFFPPFLLMPAMSADQKVCAEDYGCTLAICEVLFVFVRLNKSPSMTVVKILTTGIWI